MEEAGRRIRRSTRRVLAALDSLHPTGGLQRWGMGYMYYTWGA